jgi:hypothetical protein
MRGSVIDVKHCFHSFALSEEAKLSKTIPCCDGLAFCDSKGGDDDPYQPMSNILHG